MSKARTVPVTPIVGLVAAAWLAANAATLAADPPADWTGLDRLLAAGDYGRAIQVADDILAAPEPKRSDADFLQRKLATFKALSKRGLAELRLGQLDAAEATLAKAFRVFKEQDVQRLLSIEERNKNLSVRAKVVAVELAWIDLLGLQAAVIVERLRHANLARTTAPDATVAADDRAEREVTERTAVERSIRDLERLRKVAAAERKSLAERFEQGGTAVTASPLARSLAGPFRAAMLSGMAAIEIGSLPFPVPGPSAPAPDAATADGSAAEDGRQRWLADAVARFEEARQALDAAVAAASPTGETGLRPDARLEALMLRAELLANRAAALRGTGDLAGARADAEAAIGLQVEAAKLRKDVRPEAHPDMAWPLVVAADVAAEEARRHAAAGEIDPARTRSCEAERLAARAAALPTPDDHPIRVALAGLSARLERQDQELEKALPRSDAADAAGRRVRRAIDASSPANGDL